MIQNTSVSAPLLIAKAETSVITIAPKKTRVDIRRVLSNIFLNWVMKPMRNPVPAKAMMLPNVYNTANPII